MSPAGPHPTNPPADRDASSRALTERQMAMLTRLAEIGMEIAEAAARTARALADGGNAQAADPGLTYARAARAVRLTIALQSRLAEGLAALDRAQTQARAVDAARLRDRIHRRIERVAEAEHEDAVEVEQLSSCAWERLTETDDDDLLDLPIEEVAARICRDLGLAPAGVVSAFTVAEEAPSVGFADHDPLRDQTPASQGSRTNAVSPPLRSGGDQSGRRRTEGVSLVQADLQDTEPPPPPGARRLVAAGAA